MSAAHSAADTRSAGGPYCDPVRAVTIAAVTAMVLAAGACSDDAVGDETEVDLSEISPSPPPGGELLCDFVPHESVTLALGTGEFAETRGEVSRDTVGELSAAACAVTIDGHDRPALDIAVDWALGSIGGAFRDGLDDDRYHQLPADAGLGYTWTEDGTARGWLNHGDRIVDVRIAAPAEGRDGEADVAALARQVVATLELAPDWTLPGDPPARS